MKDKVKIGLALTACLIACLVIQYFSNFVFDFIIFLLTFLAVKEYKKLQLKAGMPSFDFCPEIACFLVFVASFTGVLCGLSAISILLIVIAIVAVMYIVLFLGSFLIFSKDLKEDKFRQVTNMSVKQFAFFKANNTAICIFYPTLLLFFMYFLNHLTEIGLAVFDSIPSFVPMGLFAIILLFAISCLTDTFAMLFGIWIKGPKLLPRVSPKKTISGALFGLLGGIIGALLTFFIFSLIFPTIFVATDFWKYIVIGLIGSVIAQGGDIFESLIKRKADTKDAGDLFKSHGGVLDRIDSVIFTCPYIFISLLFLFS